MIHGDRDKHKWTDTGMHMKVTQAQTWRVTQANIYRHIGIHTEVQHRYTQTWRETYTYNTNTQAHTEVYT